MSHRSDRLFGTTVVCFHQTSEEAAKAIHRAGRCNRGCAGITGGGSTLRQRQRDGHQHAPPRRDPRGGLRQCPHSQLRTGAGHFVDITQTHRRKHRRRGVPIAGFTVGTETPLLLHPPSAQKE